MIDVNQTIINTKYNDLCTEPLPFLFFFFYLALGGNIKHDECLHRTVALLIPFISLHIENLTFLWLLIVAMVSQ